MTRALVSEPQRRRAISTESARRDSMPSLMTRRSMTISSEVVVSGQFCWAWSISVRWPLMRMRMKPWRWRSARSLSGSWASVRGMGARRMSLVRSGLVVSEFTMSVEVIFWSFSPVMGSCGVPAAA